MTWLWFALLASSAWAVVQLVDKTLISSEAPSPRHYLVASGVAALVPTILMPLLLTSFVTFPGPAMAAGGIFAGVLYFASNAFFFKALLDMDASLSAAALAAVPGLTAIGSWLILSETIGWLPVAGLVAIAGGVIVMSEAPREARRVRPPLKAWGSLTIAGLLLVAEYLIEGTIVQDMHPLDVFFWTRVGVVLSVVVFAALRWRFVRETIRWAFVERRRVGALTVSNEALDMGAIACLIAAFSAGPVGLSTAVAYTQAAFVFVFTLMANAVVPGTIPTNSDKKGGITWRAIGLLVVVLGVFLTTT
jgi:uncharacterized membrane protein